MRHRTTSGGALLLLICLTIPPPAGAQDDREKFRRARGETIAGQYIVVFRPGVRAGQAAAALSAAHSAHTDKVWDRVLHGALLSGLSEGRARALARDPRVEWVEENGIVTVAADQPQPPSWGLDRIDQRPLPLDEVYHSDYSGRGVTIYVLDTGIRITHQDFEGRASWGANFIGGPDDDCHGHGTHVAGIAAGAAHGVAKEADLVAVKVLGCLGSGSYAGVISGIEWVTAHAAQPAVANMSLGGPKSSAVNLALDESSQAGIFYAVAAGNSDANACSASPAGASEAFTVGSTTSADERSSFSSWGACVEIFAPGSAITSAWNESDTATETLSGTSMATPHVAGVAALIREQYPGFGVAEVKAELGRRATPGIVTGSKSTSNLLLFALDEVGNYPLSITPAGSGFGAVTSSPPGIQCGSQCLAHYPPGAEVTLTGAAAAGSSFAGWGGPHCSGTDPCVVTMDAARMVQATFEPVLPLRGLTVTRAGTGSGRVTGSLPGIDCGADCSEPYGDGTVVTLTALPGAGSFFSGWNGGGCAGTDPCTVTMTADLGVTATFDGIPLTYDLTVTVDGTGEGTVTSAPAGIDCAAECTAPFVEDTVVTLTAGADAGSLFTGWVGAGCSGAGSCTVTMDAARSVTAYFDELGASRVTVGLDGTGEGIVTSLPIGIACGVRIALGACSWAFPAGTEVTLTATAGYGSGFFGWSGAGCAGTAPCSLSVTGSHLVIATFEATDVGALAVTRAGTGSGSVTSSPQGIDCGGDCAETFWNGTPVTLTAAAGPSSRFSGWSGACDGTGSCDVVIQGDKDVTATFEAVYHELTVTRGGTATGGVTSFPPGIDCGDDCAEAFLEGTIVTLTAVPEPGSHLAGWSGAPCALDEPCVVTMDAPRSVGAIFAAPFEGLFYDGFESGDLTAWSEEAAE